MRDIARSTPIYGGLDAYLLNANLVPIGLNSNTFSFIVQDVDKFQSYLAGDFDRFALSAMESFHRSRQNGKNLRFTAWRLIESYYAAFFAGHALMRAFGSGVSQVSPKPIERLSELCELYGVAGFNLDAGFIAFRALEKNGVLQLIVRKSSRGLGVHDGFWRDFCIELMEAATVALRTGQADSREFFDSADGLVNAIVLDGLGTASWLAKTRNSINYRHEFNVWFPYSKSEDVGFRLYREISNADFLFRTDLSRELDSAQLFENVNSKIVHVLWDIARLFHSISSSSKHFGGRFARMDSMSKTRSRRVA